jgi:hypothetical protein
MEDRKRSVQDVLPDQTAEPRAPVRLPSTNYGRAEGVREHLTEVSRCRIL